MVESSVKQKIFKSLKLVAFVLKAGFVAGVFLGLFDSTAASEEDSSQREFNSRASARSNALNNSNSDTA